METSLSDCESWRDIMTSELDNAFALGKTLFNRITDKSLTASLASWNITKKPQDLLSYFYCGAEFWEAISQILSDIFLKTINPKNKKKENKTKPH